MLAFFQIVAFLLTPWPQVEDRPLPDPAAFMEEFRKTLSTPDKMLSQYTYTYKETEISLDSNGKTTKTETTEYHVINGAEPWQTYERKISKNGVPLTDKDLEKQDREERERVEKETRKRASWSDA